MSGSGQSSAHVSFARDPRIALALGAVHFAISLAAVSRDTFLNNEGIFTFITASMIGDDPVPILFFLKARPPIAAFYAVPAMLGYDAFLFVHALVAAAAVPLTAALARALGLRWPNLAAALTAGSAMMIAGGASGVTNADATTLSVLAACLLFAWGRPGLAGAAAAVLPLARAETALLALVLTGCAIASGSTTRRRFIFGLVVPLVAYAALGALYHRDVIWFVHHPPHVTHSVPFSEIMGRRMFGGAPHQITLTLITLTPAVGLLAFAPVRRLAVPERAFATFLVVYLGVLSVLPGLHPLNFGDMPRYVLPAVPFLALLVARTLEPLVEAAGLPGRTWMAGMAVLAALLVVGHFQEAGAQAPALLWAVAGWALVLVIAETRWRRIVPPVTLALSLAAATLLVDATRLTRPNTPILGRYLLAEVEPGTIVLTNVAELPMWLARNGGAEIDVRHLLAADQRYEIEALANDEVGQRDAAYALLRRHWYGPVVMAEEVRGLLRAGTWLALRSDARTTHVLDEASIAGRSEVIELENGLRVVRVTGP